MNFCLHLLNAMPGAAAQGLIWGVMAIGVYITYKILDVADLTVDGTLVHRRRRLRYADAATAVTCLWRCFVRCHRGYAGRTCHRHVPHRHAAFPPSWPVS